MRGAWNSIRFSAPPPRKNAFEQALYTFWRCVILPVSDTWMAHHPWPRCVSVHSAPLSGHVDVKSDSMLCLYRSYYFHVGCWHRERRNITCHVAAFS